MYSISSAIITLLSNTNTWFAAFPSVLIFGELNESQAFVPSKSFMFEKLDFSKLYIAIASIASCIAQKTSSKETILTKQNIVYFYDAKPNFQKTYEILFGIEINFEVSFKILFDLDNFNDFVLLLTKLIFPIFCLKPSLHKLLDLASDCQIDEIINFSDKLKCYDFVQKNNVHCNEIENSVICLEYYLEIVLIVNKLKSLFNPLIQKSKINQIEST